jgi:protoporphyrinogen oxidase
MKITIIGGGISGLALGYFAKKFNIPFTIYESSNKCGGIISTQKIDSDFLIHHGPHLTRLTDEIENIFQSLGIKYSIAIKNQRFLLKNNKIVKIRPTFLQIIEILLCIFRKKKKKYTSLGDFTSHHFGKTTAENQIQAIVNGIFACNINQLSEKALKSVFFSEKRAIYAFFKKIFKTKRKNILIRPIDGFQTFIDALYLHLKQDIHLNKKITKIEENSINFITIPAYCVSEIEGVSNNIKEICNKITYQTISVATIFTENPIAIQGIGCLSNNQSGILGVLFNSSAFQEKNNSYSVFYKNLSEEAVNLWFSNFFKIKIFKSHHTQYQNAIPIHNYDIDNLIAENKGEIQIFSNYSGQISVSDIFANAKKTIEKLRFL